MAIDRQEGATGAFFVAVGLIYGAVAWRSLPIGRAQEMGPGYFPVVLSGLLICFGVAIAVRSALHGEAQSPFGDVPWRGVVMLTAAVVIFAAFFETLGLLPGVFITGLIATQASGHIPLSRALIISAGIAIFCTVLFGLGVGLPVKLLGAWVGV